MTPSEIKELKKFGYSVFEVTGWTNGKYCFDLDNEEFNVDHSSHNAKMTKELCWQAAARWHIKHFPQERMALMYKALKLRDAYHKDLDLIRKQIRMLVSN